MNDLIPLTINVTARHIHVGRAYDAEPYMAALAINDVLYVDYWAEIHDSELRIYRADGGKRALMYATTLEDLPTIATDEESDIEPFAFSVALPDWLLNQEALDRALCTSDTGLSAMMRALANTTPMSRKVIGGGLRWFYKVATKHGLDTSRSDDMKAALREYLQFDFKSRSQLKSYHWQKAAVAVENHQLAW